MYIENKKHTSFINAYKRYYFAYQLDQCNIYYDSILLKEISCLSLTCATILDIPCIRHYLSCMRQGTLWIAKICLIPHPPGKIWAYLCNTLDNLFRYRGSVNYTRMRVVKSSIFTSVKSAYIDVLAGVLLDTVWRRVRAQRCGLLQTRANWCTVILIFLVVLIPEYKLTYRLLTL